MTMPAIPSLFMLCLLRKEAPTRRQETKKCCLPCGAQGWGWAPQDQLPMEQVHFTWVLLVRMQFLPIGNLFRQEEEEPGEILCYVTRIDRKSHQQMHGLKRHLGTLKDSTHSSNSTLDFFTI